MALFESTFVYSILVLQHNHEIFLKFVNLPSMSLNRLLNAAKFQNSRAMSIDEFIFAVYSFIIIIFKLLAAFKDYIYSMELSFHLLYR